MLCSKSSSKWLHRLRSSRGFPDSDHINLEQFLSNSLHKIDPQTSTDSAPKDNRIVLEKRDDSEAVQGRDMINNVLSELFQMGEFQDLSKIKRKKSCRKQPCPRICVISTNSDSQEVPVEKEKDSSPSPVLPLTLTNRRKVKELNQQLKVTERVEMEDEEEKEKGYLDLSGYSQTEVTVIDTSVPSWKFEKMLYRRKNVWKVGDKKGKGLMMSSDRKKRKEVVNENGDLVEKKKKLKLSSSSSKSGDAEEGGMKKKKKKKRLKACNSSKYVENEEAIVRSKSSQGHEKCKTMVAAREKKQDKCSQVQEKSFPLKKQIDGGSSVIIIKSIPTTNKKEISGISKSCVKSMQK